MKNGKKICNELRNVRLKIAEANNIPYTPEECTHEGDCMGTCPKCEAETRYIERQLTAKQRLGKAAAIIGIATCTTAMAPMLSSCDRELQGDMPTTGVAPDIEEPNYPNENDSLEILQGDVLYVPDEEEE